MLVQVNAAGCLQITSGDDVVELATDEALALFGRLSGLLPGMSAPELRRGQDEDGEDVWVCPHCEAELIEDGDVIEYDSHQAESAAGFDGDSLHVSQGDTERATMAWLCGRCRRVVDVPGEVEVTW
jgi:hypothetical protein